MSVKFRYVLVITLFLTASFSGCMKKENYPDTPQIEFLGYTNVYDTGMYATGGIINISFKDGNGDIGFLSEADTFPPYQPGGPYYYNFVITYFEKRNGIFTEVDLSLPFSARIPYLTPQNPGKAIKGTISNTIEYFLKPAYDTIQYKLFIYDRALHKSNVVTTPEIILRRR
jgi:hypothetical protein